jgi:hypothetical protein
MHVAIEETQDGRDRVDVIVEIEGTLDERDVARILPVGDVDIAAGETPLSSRAAGSQNDLTWER